MNKRHTLPRLWLMSDERMGDTLLLAIRALPKGSGIIFRHYSLAPPERRALFDQVRKIAKARRHILLLAGSARDSRGWRADGHHGRSPHKTNLIQSTPIHSIAERVAAEKYGAALLFVSPVFPTASHPKKQPLGRVRFGMMIRGAKCPIIALGGMNAGRARSLAKFNIYGWAAISSLGSDPKRLETESRSHIDRLAIAAIVLDTIKPISL